MEAVEDRAAAGGDVEAAPDGGVGGWEGGAGVEGREGVGRGAHGFFVGGGFEHFGVVWDGAAAAGEGFGGPFGGVEVFAVGGGVHFGGGGRYDGEAWVWQ